MTPINAPHSLPSANLRFADARWLAAVGDDLSVRKALCDLITEQSPAASRHEENIAWNAAWNAVEAIRQSQEAAND
jgi:hypothetical protein